MESQLYCPDESRRALVRALSDDPSSPINGIDYLEVIDAALGSDPAVFDLRQRLLFVHCFLTLQGWSRDNVAIAGGVRLTPVRVLWAYPASALLPPSSSSDPIPDTHLAPTAEKALLLPLLSLLPHPDRVLVVRTDQAGDLSPYRLELSPPNLAGSPVFDPILRSVSFAFKVDCPSEFDCQQERVCTPPVEPSPQIDYLAKDYASFRRLMLDRLAVLMPNWTERNPADLAITVVELLAYAADYLSYQQDAVATEAYLGTARQRTSVRRHARLVDYLLHEGANARTWVCLTIKPTVGELRGTVDNPLLPISTPILSRGQGDAIALTADQIPLTFTTPPIVFETLHPVLLLKSSRNEIEFYTWGNPACCLSKGATQATLRGSGAELELQKGDVLILEEVRGVSGLEEEANLHHRHVVRLNTTPTERIDPINNQTVLEVSWYPEDALPFPLCLHQVSDREGMVKPISVARGNVVLADHGTTLYPDPDPTLADKALSPSQVPASGSYRPSLERFGLTHALPYDPDLARNRPARDLQDTDLRQVLPQVRLQAGNETWHPQRTLLNSDRFAPEFVVEMEADGRAYLRFGDGVLGQQPIPGTNFQAIYRVGHGQAGNIGAEALFHVVAMRNDLREAIQGVRNPLPAWGGTDPEPMEQVKLYAPQAFRAQERAVTVADYGAIAQRHPQVQRAAATRRWTGSWYSIFITVDRIGGVRVDRAFERELRTFMEPYRLAGYDIEIEDPINVPLNILLKVCVSPHYLRGTVKRSLLEIFSNTLLPNGQRGFFHPDNFTFGQPIYLSPIIATAMQVEGVEWVQAEQFERWDHPSTNQQELTQGVMALARLEIARLDNDPNAPENGKIDFRMEGGL